MRKLLLLVLLMAFTAGAVAQATKASQTTTAMQTNGGEAITSNGPVVAGFGNNIPNTGDPTQMHIAKEVRHELLMLPYYSLFDDLEYSVQGRTVTLSGYVTNDHGQTKADAERAVKGIEGVENVVNNIKILPPAPFDEQLRIQAFHHLANAGGLAQYFWEAAPSVHIIVDRQNITLKGYVITEGDKNLAGITVKELPNVFNVTNDLQVVK
jgi:osmotically-inducible protein OsmY